LDKPGNLQVKGGTPVDQKKIGAFLKELRNEKGITQERLAERMSVSNRTVSRWETGVNMPDLDVLIELADYYDVEIREILDGERKGGKMDKELKDTVLKVADYSNEEKERMTKRMHRMYLLGVAGFVIYMILDVNGLADSGASEAAASFGLGLAFGMLLVGVLYTSRHMSKIRAFKMRLKMRLLRRQ